MATETDRYIDPELVAVLAELPPMLADLGDERLEAIRVERRAALSQVQLSPDVSRTDHVIPGPDGDPDVTVRVYRHVGTVSPAPCLFAMHGGGYILGTYDMEDVRMDRWCTDLGCVGVSVEYRLAPETPYPGALEDSYAALRWVHRHADELDIDPVRLGIGGGSAGGGLAAALALLARDRKEVPVAFQLLIYPMLDDRAATSSSAWEVPIWNPAANLYGWRSYLGARYGSTDVPPTAAPARATDLSGLPPAFVCVGTADLFYDEDVAYSQALVHAGVPTEFHAYAGAIHGFESMAPESAVAKRARADATDWLRRAMYGRGR